MNKEDFRVMVDTLRDKLDDSTKAVVSEDLLNIIGQYDTLYTNNVEVGENLRQVKEERDNLLITNGKLFQKIGYPEKEHSDYVEVREEVKKPKIELSNIINNKGDLI